MSIRSSGQEGVVGKMQNNASLVIINYPLWAMIETNSLLAECDLAADPIRVEPLRQRTRVGNLIAPKLQGVIAV